MSATATVAQLRNGRSSGTLGLETEFGPGLRLLADPDCGLNGAWRSPAGRLLELEAACDTRAAWIGLHVTLDPVSSLDQPYVGFFCRSVAPAETMILVCLRSGDASAATGFVDQFFPRHVFATPEPRTHADVLYLPQHPETPAQAPWRELIFFMPRDGFEWHLHDLRMLVP